MPLGFVLFITSPMFYVAAGAALAAISYVHATSTKANMKNQQEAALRDYYSAVQRDRLSKQSLHIAQASSKEAKSIEDKNRAMSEDLQREASDREAQTSQGYRPRTLGQRQRDFGNKRSAAQQSVEGTKKRAKETLLGQSDFTQYKFNVENFNINFFGEA